MSNKAEFAQNASNAIANIEQFGVTISDRTKQMLNIIQESDSLPTIEAVFNSLMLALTEEYFIHYLTIIGTYLDAETAIRCTRQIEQVFEDRTSSEWEAIWDAATEVLSQEQVSNKLYNLVLQTGIKPKDVPFVNSLVAERFQIDPDTYEGVYSIQDLPPQTQINFVILRMMEQVLRQSDGELKAILEEFGDDLDPEIRQQLKELTTTIN